MKVIQYPDFNWTAEAECSHCHARLLIEIQDVKYDKYDKQYSVTCPVCQTKIPTSSSLPWFVERAAKGQAVGWPPGKTPPGIRHGYYD